MKEQLKLEKGPELCSQCGFNFSDFTEPTKEELCIWLHAISYECPGSWHYETPMPSWATTTNIASDNILNSMLYGYSVVIREIAEVVKAHQELESSLMKQLAKRKSDSSSIVVAEICTQLEGAVHPHFAVGGVVELRQATPELVELLGVKIRNIRQGGNQLAVKMLAQRIAREVGHGFLVVCETKLDDFVQTQEEFVRWTDAPALLEPHTMYYKVKERPSV